MKIFISTTTFAEDSDKPLDLLKGSGIDYSLNSYKRRLSEDEIKKILAEDDYSALIAGTEPLTANVLSGARSLKVISRVGTGLDNIDMDAAEKLSIKILNTPDALTDAVAELTIGLILSALRRLNIADRNIREGIWRKEPGLLFNGKVLGIIGFGRIGRRVAELARGFNAEILFYDSRNILEASAGQVSFKELLSRSDIITIHASGKKSIVSREDIDQMKDGAILINTARGGLVDEEALYDALKSRKLSYAALDGFIEEPYKGRLIGVDNILLTPHIGSYAKEARINMEIEAVSNLIEVLRKMTNG